MMPKQSLFRLVKRWKRHQSRGDLKQIPRRTRGLYILYRRKNVDDYEVVYIGVAGLGPGGSGGIRGRLERHSRPGRSEKKTRTVEKDWTHYSMFEVHDNITREEISELEAMLLAIFRDDPRVGLTNKQKGSRKLSLLRKELQWK